MKNKKAIIWTIVIVAILAILFWGIKTNWWGLKKTSVNTILPTQNLTQTGKTAVNVRANIIPNTSGNTSSTSSSSLGGPRK